MLTLDGKLIIFLHEMRRTTVETRRKWNLVRAMFSVGADTDELTIKWGQLFLSTVFEKIVCALLDINSNASTNKFKQSVVQEGPIICMK